MCSSPSSVNAGFVTPGEFIHSVHLCFPISTRRIEVTPALEVIGGGVRVGRVDTCV